MRFNLILKAILVVIILTVGDAFVFSQQQIQSSTEYSKQVLDRLAKQVDSFQATSKEHFIENKGQIKELGSNLTANSVAFELKRGNMQIFLLKSGGISWQLSALHSLDETSEKLEKVSKMEEESEIDVLSRALKNQVLLETYRMDMQLLGTNPQMEIIQEGKGNAYLNYYGTNDDNALEVGHYQKITYKNIYPGIDWVITSIEEGVKQDFIIHPGANPSLIKMAYNHQEELYIDEGGALVQKNRLGTFLENAPESFQDGNTISTTFVLKNKVVSFELATYDRSKLLVIDPLTRIWGTYNCVVNDGGGESQNDVKTDNNGNVYMSCTSYATGYATPGAFQTSGGTPSILLTKFSSSGTRLWATYYSSGINTLAAIAIDPSNNVFLSIGTVGAGLSTIGVFQTAPVGTRDAMLVKFNENGTRIWATYFGGSGLSDIAGDCATDASGNVYLCGVTSSADLPVTVGAHQMTYAGSNDHYLAKFSGAGTLLWATYYGGAGNEPFGSGTYGSFISCATDGNGNVLLAGRTQSTSNISTPGAIQVNLASGAGNADFYLVKFNSDGVRQWGTYYGGSLSESQPTCGTDIFGNCYLTGITNSGTNISTVGSHQPTLGGGTDSFMVKFNANGVRQWGTYYGGSGVEVYEQARPGFCSDNSGKLYITGYTSSTNNIATLGVYQATYIGSFGNAYLAVFDNNGMRLEGTYFAGDYTNGTECAVDNLGGVYITGATSAIAGIATPGAFETVRPFNRSHFLMKFSQPIALYDGFSAFYSECNNSCAQLVWSMTSEQTIDHFIIDESQDGNTYTFLDKVSTSGISTTNPKEYRISVDCDHESVYYRLKQVDVNGVEKILKVITPANCTTLTPYIYPNPVQGILTIQHPSKYGGKLSIYTPDGKIVFSEEMEIGLEKWTCDVSFLSVGYYYLKIDNQTFPFTKL